MSESRAETPSNKVYVPELEKVFRRMLMGAMQAGQYGPRSLTIHVKDGVIQEAWVDAREQCQRPVVR
jgi:hypothetical protein